MSLPLGPGSRLYLVDGSGYIFRAYHALPPLTRASDGLPVGAVAGFCNMLWKFLNDMKQGEKPTHLAVIFDKSEQSFRKEIYPAYKAQRPPPPDDLVPQFGLIREATRAFGVPAVELEGYEADDLIATYARSAAAAGAEVLIVSSDKDLMQLVVDGRIRMFDPMKQKALGPADVIEKFGVPPEKVIDVQALMGDSVDNVPGAPGIGQKTAAELIGLYGSVEALLERAGEIKQPKRRETLIAHAEQIRLSKQLVALKDDVSVPHSLEDFALRDFEYGTLLKFLDTMEFRTLGRRVREEMARNPLAVAPKPENAADAQGFDFDVYETVEEKAALAGCIARAQELGRVGLHVEIGPGGALIGLALALAPNRACYVPLLHGRMGRSGQVDLFAAAPESVAAASEGAPAQIPFSAALALLKPMLEDPATLKIGHDVKRVVSAFSAHAIAVAPIDCAMLLSYTLGAGLHEHDLNSLAERWLGHAPISLSEVTGSGKAQIPFHAAPIAAATRYSAEDADIALRLWSILKPKVAQERLRTVYETLERPLPTVLASMERTGIRVDLEALSRLSGDFAQKMAAREEEAYGRAGRAFNLGSPKQLGDILFGEMGLPGGTKTKTGAWSTDASVLEDLAAQGHALAQAVLDWRLVSKLRSTYTEALKEAIASDGRVHTRFALAATTTGRLSSSDPNLQNIPIRTEEGRKIREAFIAEPGCVLISADYSQIELRVLAEVGDVPQLKQAFRDGLDIHAMTASEMFGVPIAGMDPMVRRRAKAINFGIVYGISAFGLANQLSIPQSEASAYIKMYFERFPAIRDYMEKTKAQARANGYVPTISGRRLWIENIKSRTPAQRAYAERQAINAPIQGAAADIIRKAMIRMPAALAGHGLSARMLLQVHDELVFEAPEAEAEAVCALAQQVMAGAAPFLLSVPLIVEARAGRSWAAAH